MIHERGFEEMRVYICMLTLGERARRGDRASRGMAGNPIYIFIAFLRARLCLCLPAWLSGICLS